MFIVRNILNNSPHRIPRQLTWLRECSEILDCANNLRGLTDSELKSESLKLKQIFAEQRGGTRDVVQAFSIMRDAARRVHQQEHYFNQLLAGRALLDGYIIEMQTGEGKTLTALLPAYVHALSARGCHVITANEYLAVRDHQFSKPIFNLLGISTGVIRNQDNRNERRVAYSRDVTYATEKEIGFDYLKDRLLIESEPNRMSDDETLIEPHDRPVHRTEMNAAIIDEADSVLIDQARMPLIIAEAIPADAGEVERYRWCRETLPKFRPEKDYLLDPQLRRVKLKPDGRSKLVLEQKSEGMGGYRWHDLQVAMENSLTTSHYFRKDRDYLIVNDQIEIIDQNTGRVIPGRKWQHGLQLAIEMKEEFTQIEQTSTTAQTTVQLLARKYRFLCGMTGTAKSIAGELEQYYDLETIQIATRLPSKRTEVKTKLFKTRAEKCNEIRKVVQELVEQKRAILIGTPTVQSSLELAEVLQSAGIEFELLNAANHALEAEIISQAGQPGQVTIATNMAGRGTDIQVDREVLSRGGLHVILSEMHFSSRIDRQLIGRTARQGEPGSYQFLLSFEDDLFEQLPIQFQKKVQNYSLSLKGTEVPSRAIHWFRSAQQKLEREHGQSRMKMYQHSTMLQQELESLGLIPEFLTD
ncbi:preprotein translocase subunit SecA [Rubinisphaera italica]|uniref:Protein translocase subunit SecA n=1 Tax=Rubinisphaera italica TaxID=2527969 RepID=A0A5C5XFS7_9PLAN|nr:helicase-related protein [Rubinisphaera italica]TWT61499.1 preprotein translocase subunit SecA [Rubinisphaera italica]